MKTERQEEELARIEEYHICSYCGEETKNILDRSCPSCGRLMPTVPDHFRDYNALHRIIKGMNRDTITHFSLIMQELCKKADKWDWEASTEEIAEGILRAYGKWEEE